MRAGRKRQRRARHLEGGMSAPFGTRYFMFRELHTFFEGHGCGMLWKLVMCGVVQRGELNIGRGQEKLATRRDVLVVVGLQLANLQELLPRSM